MDISSRLHLELSLRSTNFVFLSKWRRWWLTTRNWALLLQSPVSDSEVRFQVIPLHYYLTCIVCHAGSCGHTVLREHEARPVLPDNATLQAVPFLFAIGTLMLD